MGYFNIFYKITRIIDMLTRKRNRRAIMVILIIIAVIFILHNKGYCAQSDSEYTTDTNYFILQEYQNIVTDIVLGFDRYYGVDDTETQRFNDLFDCITNNGYPYFYGLANGNIIVYFYTSNDSKTLYDTSLVYNDYLRVPATGYNITLNGGISFNYYRVNHYLGAKNNFTNQQNVPVPQMLLYKIPIEILDIMERAGYGYQNNQDIIDIKALLQEQNNKLDSINDSLTNTTYDDTVVDFDTSSVDNVSDTEIQGLFTGVIGSFQNALASYGGTITKIIPLPHGGQLEIPSNIVSSHLGNLSALVEAFWYFVFGIYLFRFVSNLIHKIKSGDILNGYTNDNEIITSSML